MDKLLPHSEHGQLILGKGLKRLYYAIVHTHHEGKVVMDKLLPHHTLVN